MCSVYKINPSAKNGAICQSLMGSIKTKQERGIVQEF